MSRRAAQLSHPAQGSTSSLAGRVRFAFALPFLALLWLYRKFVSPALPPACRYYPSCSQYAEEAVRLHGPLRGSWLAARRLLRCHPWAPGGFDPVPGGSSPEADTGRLGQRI
jgi:putative membrane protein insertion efficiency factor